ncbi:MAG: hypothetical protein C9356_20120 [Oleiphilus sp.]|nr:MAG: hypothetical protein C9356_20120 [Oleiphilus sp.]
MRLDKYGDEHGFKESDFILYVLGSMALIGATGVLMEYVFGVIGTCVWVVCGMALAVFNNFFIPTEQRLAKRAEMRRGE